LAKKLGIPIVAGRRQIRALVASDELAGEMQIQAGSPVLLLEGTSLDDHGNVVEFFSTWHRADRVVFDLDVVGDAAPAAGATSTTALAERVEELAREVRALANSRS
jgi:GntR family transcriptional regulator